ncbi:MAG: T9SS type A sorting domain-containing protein, partial [Saprospiraceae bacterium]
KAQQSSTKLNKYWFTIILLLFFSVAFGQLDISRPLSFQTDLQGDIPIYTCPSVDNNQLIEEDRADGITNRVGKYFQPNLSSNNFGQKEMAQIVIFDNMGRQILFQETVLFEGRNTVELSLADYHSGMYYLKVMDENNQHISKPILKK